MKVFEDFLTEALQYPKYKKDTILYTEDEDGCIDFYQIVKRDEDLCHIRRLKSKIVSQPNSQGFVLVEPMKGKFIDAKPFMGVLPYLVVQHRHKDDLPMRLWDGGRLSSYNED